MVSGAVVVVVSATVVVVVSATVVVVSATVVVVSATVVVVASWGEIDGLAAPLAMTKPVVPATDSAPVTSHLARPLGEREGFEL